MYFCDYAMIINAATKIEGLESALAVDQIFHAMVQTARYFLQESVSLFPEEV